MTIILSPGGKPWSDFRPGVMMNVRGVPMHVLDFHIKQAGIEFCEFTNCLRSTSTVLATTDGTGTYTLNPPAEVNINKLHQAWLDGVEVEVLDSQGWVDRDPLAQASKVEGVYLNSPVELLTTPVQHADLGRGLELRAQHPGVDAAVQVQADVGRRLQCRRAQRRVVGRGHVDEAAVAGLAVQRAALHDVQVVFHQHQRAGRHRRVQAAGGVGLQQRADAGRGQRCG